MRAFASMFRRRSSRSPKLAAFVAFAGPPDLLTRFARRSSPISIRQLPSPFGAKRQEGGRCRSEVSA